MSSILKLISIAYVKEHGTILEISALLQYLNKETCKKLIHAFVTAKLDFLNSLLLLHGLRDVDLNKLQRIQHAAARMLTGAKMRDHIQPILRE